MGQHKRNPVAIAAREGKIKPRHKPMHISEKQFRRDLLLGYLSARFGSQYEDIHKLILDEHFV